MLKNKLIAISIIIFMMSALVACGSEMPELTEEQSEMVNNYAAALLLKYDSSTTSRLLPQTDMDELELMLSGAPSGGITSGTIEEEQSDEPLISADDVTVNDVQNGALSGNDDIEDGWAQLSADGLAINYAGNYEVVDSYPVEDSNAYFTTDASNGQKLLVLHFNLSNISDTEASVNMNKYSLRYRVSVNGEGNVFVLTTMLDNDLLSYVGTIGSGEVKDLVAIAEISEDIASNISSIDFTIRGENGSAVLNLL